MPETTERSTTSMRCPTCERPLRRTEVGEVGFVIIDRCDHCGGAWFDQGELDALDDSPGTSAEDMDFDVLEDDEGAPPCPKCAGHMTSLSPKVAPELVVERCDACGGFWLDAGELDDMRAALLRADSMEREGAEHYLKPTGWSALRWAIYTLDKSFGAKR